MKKIFKILALPVFAVAFAFTLASCDQYAGNYKEADEETITSFQQKVSDAQAAQDENNTNYEMTAKVGGSASYQGQSVSYSFDMSNLVDISSDETKTLTYTYCNYDVKVSGQSMNVRYELWADGTDGYLNAKATMAGVSMVDTKIKGKLNKLVGGDLSEYKAMIDGYSNLAERYNLSSVAEILNQNNGAKVYVDGNKLKLEFSQQNIAVNMYVIFNEDKTYQIKVDMPKLTMQGIDMNMTAEIKPTGKKVTFPSGDYTQVQ